MICFYPIKLNKIVYLDSRILLKRAKPQLGSLNDFLDEYKLGSKLDIDHSLAQEMTRLVIEQDKTKIENFLSVSKEKFAELKITNEQ